MSLSIRLNELMEREIESKYLTQTFQRVLKLPEGSLVTINNASTMSAQNFEIITYNVNSYNLYNSCILRTYVVIIIS